MPSGNVEIRGSKKADEEQLPWTNKMVARVCWSEVTATSRTCSRPRGVATSWWRTSRWRDNFCVDIDLCSSYRVAAGRSSAHMTGDSGFSSVVCPDRPVKVFDGACDMNR